MEVLPGTWPQTLVLYPYVRVPDSISTLIPDGWCFNRSDSGWMTGETFFECVVNVFHPWLLEQAIPLPEALFIDKTMCHM